MEQYILPSHPSLISLDPLGICDEETPIVWSVITATIELFRGSSPSFKLHHLPRLIEDLSYSVHMNGNIDTRYLSRFLEQNYPDVDSPAITTLLNAIFDEALLLPTLFPTHTIPYLDAENSILKLSMQEIRSLLAHQILGTLSPPKGNMWGCTFVCWYSEPQALEKAVSGYLGTLFHYFSIPTDNSSKMTFQYYRNPSPQDDLTAWMNSESGPVCDHIILEPTSIETVEFPHNTIPCTLIASNQSPGFGSSCTQEELVTGACPPLLLLGALLISPPVPPDVCLLAYGNSPITHWRGQGREAYSLGISSVSDHTFLLLDASELDIVPEPPTAVADFHPQYLLRDINKAYTGFLALHHLQITEISSPLWGAGAFSGDPVIKALILAIAAARAGIVVYLAVDKERSYELDVREIGPGASTTVLSALQRFKRYSYLTIHDIMQQLISQEIGICRNGLDVIRQIEHQGGSIETANSVIPCLVTSPLLDTT